MTKLESFTSNSETVSSLSLIGLNRIEINRYTTIKKMIKYQLNRSSQSASTIASEFKFKN